MKILQVFDFFSLHHGGGTVALLYILARALAQRGHEVVIYTSDFELDQEYIDSLPEAKVYSFHSWFNFLGVYLMPGMVTEVKGKLEEFDIIHLHCLRSFQNIVMHHYARKFGIPYVVDAHGSASRGTGGKRGLKWLFDLAFGRGILRDASRAVAETKVGVEEYRKLGVRGEKIVIITPPFSVEEFAQLPSPGQFRCRYKIEDKHVIMFFGRIHQIKGIDFLVESFYDLTRSRDDVILAIVGSDDGFKSDLEEQINRLALSNKVLFTGFLGGEEKLSALVDADVVVQTSRYEQGAGAPFEAVLCGTPIIVTEHTGAGEDVKRLDAGHLVEFGNRKQLAEIMNKILEDPSEARDKAKRAAQYIKNNRSTDKIIGEYEILYQNCIDEARLYHGEPSEAKGKHGRGV